MNQSDTSERDNSSQVDEQVDTQLVRSASMVILYFSFSLFLAILTETMEVKSSIYYLKHLLEIGSIIILTFLQQTTIVTSPYNIL